jgi:hypothetical protein
VDVNLYDASKYQLLYYPCGTAPVWYNLFICLYSHSNWFYFFSPCISDASPATFETPVDARWEDDHPDAEEELDKKSRLEGKDGEPSAQDNKASQDFNKRKEIFRLVSEKENSSVAIGCGSQTF